MAIQKIIRRLFDADHGRRGSLSLSFAFLILPLLLALGATVEYTLAVTHRHRLQRDLDAALLASIHSAGTKDEAAIHDSVVRWLAGQAQAGLSYEISNIALTIEPSGSAIMATANAASPTFLMQVFGIHSLPLLVVSRVQAGKDETQPNAFSLFLVLDRSGSMEEPTNSRYSTTCYADPIRKRGPFNCVKTYTKMESLKLAVEQLSGQLAKADPSGKFVRTAAISYNNLAQLPSLLNWGILDALNYVLALTPAGTTDSSAAMNLAFIQLSLLDELNAHKNKNGQTPAKFIVFMTDGANNVQNADLRTRQTCDSAKRNEIRIFTIAFMAPASGQALLRYCASSADDYFAAENTADLVAAFETIGTASSKTMPLLTH